jgi:hypothetical protein
MTMAWRIVEGSQLHVTADGTVTGRIRAKHIFGFAEPAAVGQPFGYVPAEASRKAYATERNRVRRASAPRESWWNWRGCGDGS